MTQKARLSVQISKKASGTLTAMPPATKTVKTLQTALSATTSAVANKNDIQILLNWFSERQRDLPWRQNRDPYRIWISEIMLQQTTTQAVIPYFENFMQTFPTIEALASAALTEVNAAWTGLGYYSRARNLHKTAQILATRKNFPQSYVQLLELPGIGPYASRAIASQAFNEPVGVVDGNVIRVFSRLHNFQEPWWTRAAQVHMQSWADQLAQQSLAPSDLNQALMELGATVCTPQSPTCALCPWSHKCEARHADTYQSLPIKKPKKQKEIWLWQPEIHLNNKQQILLTQPEASAHLPLFLQNKWTFPGKAENLAKKPKKYDYKHTITHHEIYVCTQTFMHTPSLSPSNEQNLAPHYMQQWVDLNKVSEISPFSLVQKAIQHIIKA